MFQLAGKTQNIKKAFIKAPGNPLWPHPKSNDNCTIAAVRNSNGHVRNSLLMYTEKKQKAVVGRYQVVHKAKAACHT